MLAKDEFNFEYRLLAGDVVIFGVFLGWLLAAAQLLLPLHFETVLFETSAALQALEISCLKVYLVLLVPFLIMQRTHPGLAFDAAAGILILRRVLSETASSLVWCAQHGLSGE